jgi:hypothetical protein
MTTDAYLFAQIFAATELSRRGRLAEANALIQTLRTPPPGSDLPVARAGAPSRAANVVIDVDSVDAETTGHGVTVLGLMPPQPATCDNVPEPFDTLALFESFRIRAP